MIASFFRSLDTHRVESLLISGQAAVLYGAATFSEDIDLWIRPTADNCTRFLAALRDCGASYYKLTPPFELPFLLGGHGFHFTLPDESGSEVFLDVMGRPPRAGLFDAARGAANWMDTDWGRVQTIGIPDLVELKKTQRLEDYPVISRLVLARMEQRGKTATWEDYRWAMENIFTLPELSRLLQECSEAHSALPEAAPRVLNEFVRAVRDGHEPPEPAQAGVAAWLHERIQLLQQADRSYWRDIIAELRQLRAAGKLVPEGTPV